MKKVSCNLCGGTSYTEVLKGRDRYVGVDDIEFTLVRCTACGLVYLNPQPTIVEIQKYYPKDYPPYLTGNAVFRYGPVSRLLQKALHNLYSNPPTKQRVIKDDSTLKVLDFGCGSGSMLMALHEDHPRWELYGFDLSTNQEIKKLGAITLYYDDLTELEHNFASGSFDRIYLNNVLEHLHDPGATLERLRNLLRDNGTIIIEVPNIESFKSRLFGKYFASLDIPRHLYHFSPGTLTRLCKKSGLSVESLTFSGSAKCTTMSLYYVLGLRARPFNPILFRVLDSMAIVIGRKRVDNEAMTAKVIKPSS
jgi:SAM-dependent methyltransferase